MSLIGTLVGGSVFQLALLFVQAKDEIRYPVSSIQYTVSSILYPVLCTGICKNESQKYLASKINHIMSFHTKQIRIHCVGAQLKDGSPVMTWIAG